MKAKRHPCPSAMEALVLDLLSHIGPSTCCTLIVESRGRLKLGSAYVTCVRMMKKGYLDSYTEPRENGSPLRYFSLTIYGRKMYDLYTQMVHLMEEHQS